MNIYFIILCFLMVLNLGVSLAKNGEAKEEKYNFWLTLFAGVFELLMIYLAIEKGF